MNGTLHAPQSEFRRVLVTEVDQATQVATCINLTTGGDFQMPTTTSGYDRPQPGDAWVCTMSRGIWTFTYLIESQVSVSGVWTSEEMMNELTERTSMPWYNHDRRVPEVAFWAAVGERRLLQAQPHERWLNMGDTVINRTKTRARYPALYMVMLAEGWTIDDVTFIIPYVSGVDNANWYICAE